MIITYTPEGGEPQHFDASRLRASEIQVIERTADAHWKEIKLAVGDGDVNAMRTVAWAIKKRQEPALRIAEFDPWEDELRVRLDGREVRSYATRFVEKYGDRPEDLADAFAELRELAFDREDCESAIADATAPKDQASADPEPAPQPEQAEQESPASAIA
ncbi:hypothetical protein ACFU7X_29405 [Streptomyces chartreusis]|uniref:hypothetical protein n=1 Tax=Streptomyces chartreusis TaxID=1969 RepID=UPI0036A2F0C2